MSVEELNTIIESNPKIDIPEDFGSDGNALALVVSVKRGLKKAGWSKEHIEYWQETALSGDYQNVLRTCFSVFSQDQ